MAILKPNQIKEMDKNEREKKLEELKMELIKSRTKSGNSKAKEIRKVIARILTFNKANKAELKNK